MPIHRPINAATPPSHAPTSIPSTKQCCYDTQQCAWLARCARLQEGHWSETGDRYLLKLFRDFVFHQTAPPGHEAEGGPLMDWGHVVETLNKVRERGWGTAQGAL